MSFGPLDLLFLKSLTMLSIMKFSFPMMNSEKMIASGKQRLTLKMNGDMAYLLLRQCDHLVSGYSAAILRTMKTC